MSDRWEIYLNGRDGVAHVTYSLLGMWKHIFPLCGMFAVSFGETLRLLLGVIWCVIAPFFFWTAPVIAIFTAHRFATDEEIRARLRAGIHKDGPI